MRESTRASSGPKPFQVRHGSVPGPTGSVANVVTVLNPGFVVLGGGVMTRSPRLVQRVCDMIGERTLAVSRSGLKVALAAHGDDSGAVGAALLGAEGY